MVFLAHFGNLMDHFNILENSMLLVHEAVLYFSNNKKTKKQKPKTN
jgi:hypothetical protein